MFYLLFSLSLPALSQYDVEKIDTSKRKDSKINFFELKQRIFVGGDFNFWLRQGSTYVFASPIAGYDIVKEKFSVGLSTMYQFYAEKYLNQYFTFHSYGGGIFVRYRPFKPLLIQTEFDLYNTNDFAGGTFERVNVPLFMLGAGYAQSLGEKAYLQYMLFYDFVGDPNSPLPPIFFNFPIYMKYGFVFYLG